MLENNKIYQGDCLEIMKQIKDKSIDLVLTDPPYLITGGAGKFKASRPTYQTIIDGDISKGFNGDILKEIKRIMKVFNAYFFCSKSQLKLYLDFTNNNNFNFSLLTWIKTNPSPLINNKYLSDTEYIFLIREKGAYLKPTYRTAKSYFLQNNGVSTTDHPTEKPLNIISTLMKNSSKENDLILDPFLGSGTTAVACQELHRNFIGIEISEKYCQIARDRLKQQPLF